MRITRPGGWLSAWRRRHSSGLAGVVVMVILGACGMLPEPEVGLACMPPESVQAVEQPVETRNEFHHLLGMRPQQVEAELAENDPGVEVTWRYQYPTDAGDGKVGYSECWCSAPPDGRVIVAEVTEFGQLLVMVEREAPIIGGRAQPRLGWGCDEARLDRLS